MANGLCECGCGEAAPIAKRNVLDKGYVRGEPMRFVVGHSRRGKRSSPLHVARIRVRQSRLAALPARRPSSPPRPRRSATPRIAAKETGSRPVQRSARANRTHRFARDARHKKKIGSCEWCHASYTEWANISGEYRRDLSDFAELCVPCHRRLDRGRA